MVYYNPLASFAGAALAVNSSNTIVDISSAADDESFGVVSSPVATTNTDIRLRLRAKDGQADQIYGKVAQDNVLSIMHPDMTDGTNGLLFPYTPVITFSQGVNYSEAALVHTNYGYSHYTGTPNASIDINATFTVQNQREGAYAIAVLHFLRTVSKMYFGEQDKANKLAGLPPPVLLLEGYGNGMFNELPVIVQSHGWSFDDQINMVLCESAGITMYVPAKFTVNIKVVIQQTPTLQRTEFSLDKFRTGELMRKNKGWI
jgi:hypothetical protein